MTFHMGDARILIGRDDLAAQVWARRAGAAFVKEGCGVSMLEALRSDGHYELANEDGASRSDDSLRADTGRFP